MTLSQLKNYVAGAQLWGVSVSRNEEWGDRLISEPSLGCDRKIPCLAFQQADCPSPPPAGNCSQLFWDTRGVVISSVEYWLARSK